jgi:hypothetical protein
MHLNIQLCVIVTAAIVVIATAHVAGSVAIRSIRSVNNPRVRKFGGMAKKENTKTIDRRIWTIKNGNHLLGSHSFH